MEGGYRLQIRQLLKSIQVLPLGKIGKTHFLHRQRTHSTLPHIIQGGLWQWPHIFTCITFWASSRFARAGGYFYSPQNTQKCMSIISSHGASTLTGRRMSCSKCTCKHGFLLKTQVHAKQTRHITKAHRRAEHLLVESM